MVTLVLSAERFEVRPRGAAFLFELQGPAAFTVPEGYRLPANKTELARLAAGFVAGSVLYGRAFDAPQAAWLAAGVRLWGANELQKITFDEQEAAGWFAVASHEAWGDQCGGRFRVAIKLLPEAEAPADEMSVWRVQLPRGYTPAAVE